MPLSDRDYMRPSSPRRYSGGHSIIDRIASNPVYILLVVNILLYIFSFINRSKLLEILGLSPAVFKQKPWTLLTYMFVHVDFWSLFGNMIILFFFGTMVYRIMGGWRFNVVYFCGGIVGGVLYILLGDPRYFIGAFGAVYALMGALVVMMPTLEVRIWFILPVPLWVVVLVSFLILTLPNFFINTLWQPFVGGLAVGLIAGFIYKRQMRYIIYR